MAGRSTVFATSNEELSTADVVLYEGEAPSSLLPEIPVFQVGEGIDLEYGLDPVNDPAGTLACMDAVVDEQLASLDAEHDLAAAKEELFRVVKAQAKLEAELESLAGGIEEACEETGGRLRKLVIEAEFRGLISQELCAEDALRTAMQYLIHKIGVSNAIVATPGLDGWQLGAYVNVDAPRDATQDVVDRVLERADHFASANVISSNGTELQAKLDLDHSGLDGRTCVWTGSYDEAEAKASLIFFRNESSPFRQEDLETIDVVSTLLGRQLGGLERIELRAQPEEDSQDEQWRDAA
ncbi:MAG: hypothetical protein ACPGGL_06900, partial [Phycisphaerales bacterium]